MAEIPCPPRFRVEQIGPTWIVSWRWFSPLLFFMILFCIAWDAFLIFWYTMAFTSNAPWIMIVFPIAHLGVGIGLTYSTLAGIFNSTRIEVNRGEVTIRSGPVPWFGNRVLLAGSVRQVFTRTSVSTDPQDPTFSNRGRRSIGLMATLADGRTIRLVGGLLDTMEAGFLQQQLEQRIDVRPSPLPLAV